MIGACCDGDYAGQPADRHRRQPVGGRTVAELAVIVLPPTAGRFIVQQGAGMGKACDNGNRIVQVADRYWRYSNTCNAVTELAVPVVAPAARGSISE